MCCKHCGHSVILSGISAKGLGHYVCAMRRENRCQSAYIRRDLTDRFLISGLIQGASTMVTRQSVAADLSAMTAQRAELAGKLQNVIRAIEQAEEVIELSARAKALSAEIRQLEKEITLIKGQNNIKTEVPTDEMNISHRKEWQRLARKTVRIIKMDKPAKTCDIYLLNGMKILNYPLTKATAWSAVMDAMAYLDENEIIL